MTYFCTECHISGIELWLGQCLLIARYRPDSGHPRQVRVVPEVDIRQNAAREKKDRLAAVSPKPNRIFGSDGCALGVFDLEVASDSIEHGHLSLLDRCGGIVDGERSVFIQRFSIVLSTFNA